jgi:hypothetical protein
MLQGLNGSFFAIDRLTGGESDQEPGSPAMKRVEDGTF